MTDKTIHEATEDSLSLDDLVNAKLRIDPDFAVFLVAKLKDQLQEAIDLIPASVHSITDEQIIEMAEQYGGWEPSQYDNPMQYHAGQPGLIEFARALLAQQQTVVQGIRVDGWKLVPLEPDLEMIISGRSKINRTTCGDIDMYYAYQAMLDAAPTYKGK